MKVIVVGCGKVGTAIISSLVNEGHDVIAIDKDPDVISEIANIYDVMGICGNGVDCEILVEADISKCDLFVSFTGSDESNMLACLFAKKMGADHTIARIRNPEYNDQSLGFMRQQLELSMSINPEMLAARDLFYILRFPAAVKIEQFSRRNLEMIELRLANDSQLHGMTLSKLRDKFKAQILICAVQRGNEIYIPDGNFVLNGGDKIGLTGTPSEIQKFSKMLGTLRKQSKNVMVLGGSTICYYLAKMFSSTGNSIKIIEKDYDRCQYLSSELPNAVVLQGDGAQQELLLEEGLDSLDAFVALTGIDEENILISIFASMHNVPKVMCKVTRDELIPMAEKIGIDCLVSPKDATSSIITGFARALENSKGSKVETLYRVMDGKAEALEFSVNPESKKIINIPLKDLKFKKNTLVAGILRGRRTIIPSGNDIIMPDDKVIVIAAKNQKLQDLSDILD